MLTAIRVKHEVLSTIQSISIFISQGTENFDKYNKYNLYILNNIIVLYIFNQNFKCNVQKN